MERVKTIFTCVSLRTVPGGLEAKFTHEADSVILRVSQDVHVALGHLYQMSMKPIETVEEGNAVEEGEK